MSATAITRSANFTELTRAADAFRNMTAVSSLLLAWFVASLLIVLGVESGSPALIGLLGLIAIVVALTGVSAAGIHLMVQLKQLAPRSLSTGFIQGLFATGKIIVVALAVILAGLIFVVPVALILLICKIPFIGPILYTFMVPLLTVIGALFYAGLFVAWQLLGPAIWEGNTIFGSIARLAAIARQRAIQVIINLIILGILMFIATLVLVMFFAIGYAIMRGMSAGVLGNQLPGGLLGQTPFLGEPTAHESALRIGTSILATLTSALLLCPLLMGLNIIYLNASEGIDASDVENRLNAGLQQARAKAAQMQESAREKTGPQSGGGEGAPSGTSPGGTTPGTSSGDTTPGTSPGGPSSGGTSADQPRSGPDPDNRS